MRSQIQIQNDPIINLPNLYKFGLQISNPDGSGSTVLNISAGSCRDSNNIMDIEVGNVSVENVPNPTAPLVIDSLLNGINALDTGTIAANTMYAVYMLADSRYYLPTAAILTLASNVVSGEGPLAPFGYDSKRLIGYWPTDNSGKMMNATYQGTGTDLIFWYAGNFNRVLESGTATTLTNVDLAPWVPPIENTLVVLTSSFIADAPADNYIVSSFGSTASDFFQYGQVAAIPLGAQFSINSKLIMGSANIQYLVSTASANLSLWINGFYVSV